MGDGKGAMILGVDVGGTFTDLLLADPGTGGFRIAKVSSTPADQSDGFMNGLAALGVDPGALETVIHGTTVGTNAVLERSGVRCGVITTRGFRDTLELGRRTRPNAWGMFGHFEPIVPRERRLEVTERVDAGGNVVTPLDENEMRGAVEALRDMDVEAVIISFFHAYLNPDHERRAGAIAREVWPECYVTLGSDILREVREFERGSTAALNGYIQPIMTRYLGHLQSRLRAGGFTHDLLVMQGNGGMMTAGIAGEKAVQTVMSGPAAGAIAAAHLGRAAGFPNVISCDMGGTSFDIAIVRGGAPATTTEKDISYGMPLRVPMVDIQTIGAGGGSIAWIDDGGLLRVGPQSAGATPGPICYGRGGTEPTVTDANLLLGRIDPRSIAGLDVAPDVDAVARVMREKVGEPLGLDATEAAAAVLRVVDHEMAGAARLVSVDKGHDPREFALFAFGGAGPMHATAIARELGVPTVLVPRFPGITSALGCVLADVRHDFVQSVHQPLAEADPVEADRILASQAEAGRALLKREAVAVANVEVTHEADLAGCFRPITVTPPKDTFLYAEYPRPVSGCAAETAQRVMEAFFGAMGRAIPDRIFAAPAGTSGNFSLGGEDPEQGRRYVMYIFSGGGYGGWWGNDGLTNGCSSVGISKTQPAEILEQHYPILFEEYALREGSAGAGRHRGGFGVSYRVRLLRGEAKASFMMDHGRTGPHGLAGGHPGALNEIELRRGDSVEWPPHLSKGEGYLLRPGDVVQVRTPGGGGLGDPRARARARVEHDLRCGYLTEEDAARDYGYRPVPKAAAD